MKHILKLLILASFIVMYVAPVRAQNAIAKIKYEQAEEAFIANDYVTTITRLNEAEKILGASNPKILYLRLMADKGIIVGGKYDYDFIAKAREDAEFYIKTYSEIEGIEGKFREVYDFSETLGKLPATQELFENKRKVVARLIQVNDSLRAAYKVKIFATVSEFQVYYPDAFKGMQKCEIPAFVACYTRGNYSSKGPLGVIFNEKGLFTYSYVLKGTSDSVSGLELYQSLIDLYPTVLDKDWIDREEIKKDQFGNERGSILIKDSPTVESGYIHFSYTKTDSNESFIVITFFSGLL